MLSTYISFECLLEVLLSVSLPFILLTSVLSFMSPLWLPVKPWCYMYFLMSAIPFVLPFLEIKSAVLCAVLMQFYSHILPHNPDHLSKFYVEFKDMVPGLVTSLILRAALYLDGSAQLLTVSTILIAFEFVSAIVLLPTRIWSKTEAYPPVWYWEQNLDLQIAFPIECYFISVLSVGAHFLH